MRQHLAALPQVFLTSLPRASGEHLKGTRSSLEKKREGDACYVGTAPPVEIRARQRPCRGFRRLGQQSEEHAETAPPDPPAPRHGGSGSRWSQQDPDRARARSGIPSLPPALALRLRGDPRDRDVSSTSWARPSA